MAQQVTQAHSHRSAARHGAPVKAGALDAAAAADAAAADAAVAAAVAPASAAWKDEHHTLASAETTTDGALIPVAASVAWKKGDAPQATPAAPVMDPGTTGDSRPGGVAAQDRCGWTAGAHGTELETAGRRVPRVCAHSPPSLRPAPQLQQRHNQSATWLRCVMAAAELTNVIHRRLRGYDQVVTLQHGQKRLRRQPLQLLTQRNCTRHGNAGCQQCSARWSLHAPPAAGVENVISYLPLCAMPDVERAVDCQPQAPNHALVALTPESAACCALSGSPRRLFNVLSLRGNRGLGAQLFCSVRLHVLAAAAAANLEKGHGL